MDFLGHPVVKNPSSSGDSGLIPGQRTNIPHTAGPLSLCTTATETVGPGAQAPHLEGAREFQLLSQHKQKKKKKKILLLQQYDELRGHYAKSDKERQILSDTAYM